MKKYLLGFLALVVLFSLNIYAKNYPYKTERERKFELRGDDSIHIKIPRGTIEIIQTNDNFVKIATEALFENKEDHNRVPLSDGNKVKNNEQHIRYIVLGETEKQYFKGDRIINLKVYTPFTVKIKAEIDAGTIKIVSKKEMNNITLHKKVQKSFDYTKDNGKKTLIFTKKDKPKVGQLKIDFKNDSIDVR